MRVYPQSWHHGAAARKPLAPHSANTRGAGQTADKPTAAAPKPTAAAPKPTDRLSHLRQNDDNAGPAGYLVSPGKLPARKRSQGPQQQQQQQQQAPKPTAAAPAQAAAKPIAAAEPRQQQFRVLPTGDRAEPAPGGDDIFSLARHNKVAELAAALQRGALLVDRRDVHGNTVLMIACQNGHKNAAKAALRKHADLNAQNDTGNTALHFCYAYGFKSLADYLVGKGADLRLRNKLGLLCFQNNGTAAARAQPLVQQTQQPHPQRQQRRPQQEQQQRHQPQQQHRRVFTFAPAPVPGLPKDAFAPAPPRRVPPPPVTPPDTRHDRTAHVPIS